MLCTATYATSRATFVNSATEIVDTVKDWRLTVSIVKTKGMVVGADVDESAVAPLRMENGSIEMVDTFPILEVT